MTLPTKRQWTRGDSPTSGRWWNTPSLFVVMFLRGEDFLIVFRTHTSVWWCFCSSFLLRKSKNSQNNLLFGKPTSNAGFLIHKILEFFVRIESHYKPKERRDSEANLKYFLQTKDATNRFWFVRCRLKRPYKPEFFFSLFGITPAMRRSCRNFYFSIHTTFTFFIHICSVWEDRTWLLK